MKTKKPIEELTYNWSIPDAANWTNLSIEINDETLREGIQSPSASTPCIQDKLEILSILDSINIDNSCVSFPAANEKTKKDTETIIKYKHANELKIGISCAARTVESDIVPIAKLSQKTGYSVGANIFVGSSPIRRLIEDWDNPFILKHIKESVEFALNNDLPVCFITEDTTRSRPKDLYEIYMTAIDSGAERVCICDTVGESTPAAVRNIVRYVKKIIKDSGNDVTIDWHGHNDRGLGLINAMVAIHEGANRIHTTGLGIGERTGNTSLEQLLANLLLLGYDKYNISEVAKLSKTVSKAFNIEIPVNFPVVGSDAFRTATGVHASAILKARKQGSTSLEDSIYSSIPANALGFSQKIEVGPMSGRSNVTAWLMERQLEYPDNMIDIILSEAKKSDKLLDDSVIYNILNNEKDDASHHSMRSNKNDSGKNDEMLSEFYKQKEQFELFLTNRSEIKIATLGPRGTTSYEAMVAIINYIKNKFESLSIRTILKDNFEGLAHNLKNNEIDMIIVPNAYQNISNLYWDSEVENLYSFLMNTPNYGLAAPEDFDISSCRNPIRVSLCQPVYQLLENKMTEVFGKDAKYEIIEAYSTVESVKKILEGKADCTITNETSIRGTSIKFISSVNKSTVLWSIFCSRQNKK